MEDCRYALVIVRRDMNSEETDVAKLLGHYTLHSTDPHCLALTRTRSDLRTVLSNRENVGDVSDYQHTPVEIRASDTGSE